MAENISQKIKETIKELVNKSNRVIFLGIGEVRMTDDGFGPYVTSYFTINKLSTKRILFINGKTDYINRKQEILDFHPDLILVIDTCESGDPRGTFIIATEDQMADWVPISSHVIPIQVFLKEVKQNIPNLQSFLLGINYVSLAYTDEVRQYLPEKYSLDDYEEDPDLPFYEINLTSKVKSIADELIKFLKDLLIQ